jgi:hypothetical protein
MSDPVQTVKEAALALLVAVAAFSGGYFTRALTYHPAPTKAQEKAVAKVEKAQAESNSSATAEAVKQQEKIHVVYRSIAVATPAIVTPAVDRAYPLPDLAVSVWNAAATGNVSSLPPASGGIAAQPSTVPLSQLLDAHTADIEQCRSEEVKYQQLWDWAVAQAKISEEAVK